MKRVRKLWTYKRHWFWAVAFFISGVSEAAIPMLENEMPHGPFVALSVLCAIAGFIAKQCAPTEE